MYPFEVKQLPLYSAIKNGGPNEFAIRTISKRCASEPILYVILTSVVSGVEENGLLRVRVGIDGYQEDILEQVLEKYTGIGIDGPRLQLFLGDAHDKGL